jgi:hypothetical protein
MPQMKARSGMGRCASQRLEKRIMSSGEIAYLALVVTAFASYVGLLAYGVAMSSERPTGEAPKQKQRMREHRELAGQMHR